MAGSVSAGEFSGEPFTPRTGLERRFREARKLEASDAPGALKLYRELAGSRGFPVPDALEWALARLSPPEKAERHWQNVLRAQPRSPFAGEALRGLLSLYKRQGRIADAEGVARRLLENARSDAERASALGALLTLLNVQGKTEEVRQTARRLWVEYPQFPEGRGAEASVAGGESPFDVVPPSELLARGKRLLDRGSREEAARTLSELRLRLSADSPLVTDVNLALGRALVFLKRFQDAREPLAEARLDPTREEEARYQMARAFFGLNRGDVGAADLVDLARSRPTASRAASYLLQAQRVFDGRKLWRQARRAEGLLLRRYPRSAEAREVASARGRTAWTEGRFEEAAARFWESRQGLKRDLAEAQALYWGGRALLELGEEDTGRASLETVVASYPLGYYGVLSKNVLTGLPPGPIVTEARLPKSARRPLPDDFAVPNGGAERDSSDALTRAQAYLRLGLPGAAREILRGVSPSAHKMRLLYWAEDFQGALSTSGRTWLDWPRGKDPAPLDAAGLAYPIAYPRSTADAAQEAGVHPHLVLAIAHTESHFDPRVFSPAEARGLMQFIPATGAATAHALGIRDFTVDQLYEPKLSLRLGAKHLRELLDRFRGDVVLAVAAYNAGAGAVDRWVRDFGGLGRAEFVEAIPYKETRRYVKKVLTALDAYGRLDPPGLWGAGPVSAEAVPDAQETPAASAPEQGSSVEPAAD